MALCFIGLRRTGVIVDRFFCANEDFRPFFSCDLDLHLDTMTFIYDLPVFPGDVPDMQIWTSYVKAFESYRLTDRHDRNYKPFCFAAGQILQLLTKELTVVFSRQDKRCWCCSWNMSSCMVESGDPGTHSIPASNAAWRCWFIRLRSRYALDVICWVIRICASRDFYQTHTYIHTSEIIQQFLRQLT